MLNHLVQLSHGPGSVQMVRSFSTSSAVAPVIPPVVDTGDTSNEEVMDMVHDVLHTSAPAVQTLSSGPYSHRYRFAALHAAVTTTHQGSGLRRLFGNTRKKKTN